MTLAPDGYAAEDRRRGDRGFWRLLVIRPTESACWDDLLAAPALRNCDLRVRPLHRLTGQSANRRDVPLSTPPHRRKPETFP
jgi:hypothetical protein